MNIVVGPKVCKRITDITPGITAATAITLYFTHLQSVNRWFLNGVEEVNELGISPVFLNPSLVVRFTTPFWNQLFNSALRFEESNIISPFLELDRSLIASEGSYEDFRRQLQEGDENPDLLPRPVWEMILSAFPAWVRWEGQDISLDRDHPTLLRKLTDYPKLDDPSSKAQYESYGIIPLKMVVPLVSYPMASLHSGMIRQTVHQFKSLMLEAIQNGSLIVPLD